MEEIRLTDVIDVNVLQAIQDAFAKATGVAAVAYDLDHEVTKISNPSQFCINLTRGCPEGYKRCSKCDLDGGSEAARTRKPSVYYCHAGLVDFAAPIMIGSRQIGSIVGGQVLTEAPDEEKFRSIAREIGVDEDKYIEELSKIKIMPKHQIEAVANLLFEISGEMSNQGLQKLRLSDSVDELVNAYERLSKRLMVAEDSIKSMAERTNDLKTNFEELAASSSKSNERVEKTNSVVKKIKDVSEQTRILGFNASIEAARSGAAGAGFSVIAQEVRRLADDSQKYTESISTALEDLESSIGTVSENVGSIFNRIDENAKTAEQLVVNVREVEQESQYISGLCQKLKS